MLTNRENPYFAKIEREFIEAYSKRADLISDMSSTSFEECKKNEERIASLAAQLVKSGVEAEVKGKSIEITIGEEIYTVSKTNLRKTLAEDFWIIFPEVVEDNELDTPLNTYEAPINEDSPFNSINSALAPVINALITDETIKDGINKLLSAIFPPAEKKPSFGLLEDINSIQRKVESIETERTKALTKLESTEKEYAQLKSELEATSIEYASKIAELEENEKKLIASQEAFDALNDTLKESTELIKEKEATITEKEKILNDFKSKIGNLRTELENAKNEKNSIANKISTLTDEKAQLSRDLAISEREKDDLAKKITVLEENEKKLISNADNLREQLKKSVDSGRVDEIQRQNNNLKNERDSFRNKTNDLQKKLEEAENKLAEAEKYKDIAESSKKEAVAAKEKVAFLENLAYIDQMTQVKNVNSFNKEFGTLDLKASMVIMVGIRGVKKLNLERGRKMGDRIIKFVASSLAKVFGNELIYRTVGDQFVIVSNNLKYVEAENEMYKIKNSLKADDVDIVYGIVSGFSYENPKETLEAVEQLMNKSKNAPMADMRGYGQTAPVRQMDTTSYQGRQDFSADNINVDEG